MPWVLAAIALLLVSAASVAIAWRSGSDRTAALQPSRCTSGVGLSVVADPSIADAIDDLADRWEATKPIVDSACPTVTVHGQDSAALAGRLTSSDMALPQIWIPDSTLWVDRVRHDTADRDSAVSSMWVYPPVAASPLVVATTAAQLTATRQAAAHGWASLLRSSSAPATTDPERASDGLAALLTAQRLLGGHGSTPSRQLINALVRLAHGTVTDDGTALRALGRGVGGAPALVTSEQAVRAANADSATKTAIVYPRGAAVGLDWPVVQFAPPGGEPALRDAATAFVTWLSGPASRTRLQAAGLRSPAGAGTPVTHELARPTVAQQTEALRAWVAAGRTSRTLVVIDLSGSMRDSIGGGRTKIEFAAAAEQAAIKFFPDSSSLGLWGFSVDRTSTSDWTTLVPLGPLGDAVGATSRRQALIDAARHMPSLVGGNTGLYTTTLAAYDRVRSGYDPQSVNSVVVLTDGANTDTRGIDLTSLLERLRSERDARRPLHIITIAVGRDADTTTLHEISAATGGRSYVAVKPGDIQDALLDAIITAG